jgi:hypothetical protein
MPITDTFGLDQWTGFDPPEDLDYEKILELTDVELDIQSCLRVIENHNRDNLRAILARLSQTNQMKLAQVLDSIQTETPLWEYESPERTLKFEELQKLHDEIERLHRELTINPANAIRDIRVKYNLGR